MSQKRSASLLTRVKEWTVALIVVTCSFIINIATSSANPTVIGVDGTKVHIPINFFGSALAVNHGMLKKLPGYNVVTVKYPRSFGILTLGGPGYDRSVAIGKTATIKQIKKAQNGDPNVSVKLACYSQGADVCTQVNDQLYSEGYSQTGVEYLLLGNVDNAYGGSKVWIPHIGKNGVFIPGPGVTLGNATPTKASDAKITQLLYQYDGFARAPEYPMNILADLNAIVGILLEHGSYGRANPDDPRNIVSTTPDGRITNIMIPVNEVPLLTLARLFGMPRVVANIINPTLKAIIDNGYGPVPCGPGTYPIEAVSMKLHRSKEKRQQDFVNIKVGFAESKARLKEVLQSPSDEKRPDVFNKRVVTAKVWSLQKLTNQTAVTHTETSTKEKPRLGKVVRKERTTPTVTVSGFRQNSNSNQHHARSAKSPRHIS